MSARMLKSMVEEEEVKQMRKSFKDNRSVMIFKESFKKAFAHKIEIPLVVNNIKDFMTFLMK